MMISTPGLLAASIIFRDAMLPGESLWCRFPRHAEWFTCSTWALLTTCGRVACEDAARVMVHVNC
jgi:hypothetical protein